MSTTSLFCYKFGGIHKQKSEFSKNKITAIDLQNVELYDTGVNSGVGIRTALGNTRICNLLPSDEKIINIFQSIQGGNTYFFIHAESTTEGKIYLFSPTSQTLTEKVNSLTVTGKSSATDFAQGWSDLFVFSNGEELLTIELGHYVNSVLSEVTNITATDTDNRTVKGLGIINFDGRLWVFNGNVLWYSVQQDIDDFSTSDADIVTSAGYIEFPKNITAITTYLSSVAVFYEDSSCLVSVSDGVFSVSDECPGGCAGYKSFVFHGTELYFYDHTKKGIFSFNQSVLGNKTLGDNIAIDLQEELCSITDVNKLQMQSVILADRNEFWFLLTNSDETLSTILIYDYNHKEWVKRVCPKISCINIIDENLYSADSNGKIYQEYLGADFHGTFVKSYYLSSALNFGVDNLLKIIFIPPKIALDTSYANNFYVEYIKNNDSLKKSKKRNIKSKTLKNVLYWDIGKYDEKYYPPQNLNNYSTLPSDIFKSLQFKFYTTQSGQDFSIRNIEFTDIKIKKLF